MFMNTLVLGLGNPILSDDGIDIRIVREIKKFFKKIDILEANAAGFRVIDEIVGYDRLIIVDSIKTGKAKSGTLHRFSVDDFQKTLHTSSPHDINFFDALAIMEQQNEKLPSIIYIYAVEVRDTSTFSEKCTDDVEAVIPEVVQIIINERF